MSKINPQIENSWKEILEDEFNKPYFNQLKEFLIAEKKENLIYINITKSVKSKRLLLFKFSYNIVDTRLRHTGHTQKNIIQMWVSFLQIDDNLSNVIKCLRSG